MKKKTSTNSKRLQISEALRIQASKTPKNFHLKSLKTKNIQRTHKKQEEHEERRISNKLIIRFITISFQRYFNPFSNQSEDILCLNQNYTDTIIELMISHGD